MQTSPGRGSGTDPAPGQETRLFRAPARHNGKSVTPIAYRSPSRFAQGWLRPRWQRAAQSRDNTRMQSFDNADAAELAKFDAMAPRWWDEQGDFRALHDLNPVRLQFIEARAPLRGRQVLDVGCGGGLLAEAMARRGAIVTGIDLAAGPLEVARLHAIESGIEVDYQRCAAELFAARHEAAFDVVTCLEMLEHVPEPSTVVAALARLVKPGGHVVCSTINRGPKAFALAILGAEYLLQLLPRGTHEYAKFIRPSELARFARAAGLQLIELAGLDYNPFTHEARVTRDTSVNYLAHFTRPGPVAD